MYRVTTAIIIILSAFHFTTAQITITSDDLLGLIGTTQIIEYSDTSAVAVNVGSAGENQMWDFTDVPIAYENPISVLAPEETPFAEYFPEANFVIFYDLSQDDTTFNLYSYANLSANRFHTVGQANVMSIPELIDTSFVTFDEDENPMPFSYGLKWDTIERDTMEFAGVLTITIRESQYTIDAWGSVKIPAGTFECLRMREDFKEKTVYIFNDMELPSDSTSGISYSWLSKDNLLVCDIVSTDGETNPEFTMASEFSRLKSQTTAVDEELNSAVAESFILEQNYPNPFNPVTMISYSIAEADHVNLSVYDSAGRLVLTLVNGVQNAGQHSVQWNAAGLASGIYYYRLQSGQFSKINKAILLK